MTIGEIQGYFVKGGIKKSALIMKMEGMRGCNPVARPKPGSRDEVQ